MYDRKERITGSTLKKSNVPSNVDALNRMMNDASNVSILRDISLNDLANKVIRYPSTLISDKMSALKELEMISDKTNIISRTHNCTLLKRVSFKIEEERMNEFAGFR